MDVDFTKMHGLGNDFIVISELDSTVVVESEKPEFAITFCRRNQSVGADGVLFLQPSDSCDFRMRIYNADGGEAENCVNGLRCVAFKYHSITGEKTMCVESDAGPVDISIEKKGERMAVAEMEIKATRVFKDESELKLKTGTLHYNAVDIGNPHSVIFLDEDVSDFPVHEIGKSIENHETFSPARTNVEFVNVISGTALKMRVWERGVGETMSCGTGSIASVIAACERGLCKKDVWIKVEQPGGVLEVKYGDRLFLRGPVEISYEGKLSFGK